MDKEKVERKADLQVDAAESNLKGIDDDFRFHSIDTESYYVTDSDPDSNPDSDSDEDEDEGKVEGNKDEGEDQEAGTVQALWDKCLPERTEDVRINPAIKHVVIGCLNEWRSTIGKKAVTILGDFIKHDVTLSNSSEVATFVRALLPHPREHPIAFPFIYADSEASKGSWLAPLLLQVFAVHLRRVVKAPTNFGYPAGALAPALLRWNAASVSSKLGTTFKTKPPMTLAMHLISIPGADRMPISQSICDLRERKWVQILHAASVYLGPSDTEISVIPDGRSRIVVSDDE
ncbi:hypothetical protein EDB84DRAFT_1565151 [Lactarius hengduanensis]|nr:hypothetical protein EDB84DRAFT_1565151 [Lactarius hengduanensis]